MILAELAREYRVSDTSVDDNQRYDANVLLREHALQGSPKECASLHHGPSGHNY